MIGLIKLGFRYVIGEMEKIFWRDKIEINILKFGLVFFVVENWL